MLVKEVESFEELKGEASNRDTVMIAKNSETFLI